MALQGWSQELWQEVAPRQLTASSQMLLNIWQNKGPEGLKKRKCLIIFKAWKSFAFKVELIHLMYAFLICFILLAGNVVGGKERDLLYQGQSFGGHYISPHIIKIWSSALIADGQDSSPVSTV